MKCFYPLFLLAIFISIGCSSSGQNPSLPTESNSSVNLDSPMNVGVADIFPDGSPASGTGFLGVYSLSLNPQSTTADLVPLRNSSLTDVLEVVDITNFLTMAPCADCAKIRSVALDADNHLVVSIGIKHPFDVGDPYKPITGKNRADLHVFNVEGIVVSNASSVSFPLSGVSIADFSLVNADGYTGYLDNSLDAVFPSGASIHPYILHFDDYSSGNFSVSNPMGFESVTNPPPSGNLVMAMGCDFDYQNYVFAIDDSTDFIFAVGCTYAVSAANKSLRFTPEFRIPQHNKKSPSEVGIEIVSNDLKGGIATSTAQVRVNVVDTSHGVAVGDALNQMFADSSVSQVIIDIPGVMSNQLTLAGNSSISGSGHSPSDPLVYEATITNTASGEEGDYHGLVKVLDSYSTGLNTSPLLNSQDGITRVDPTQNPLTGLFAINEFATYQVFPVSIGAGGTTPECEILSSDDECTVNEKIIVNPGSSNDPDGRIVLYEYDFDYDGVNFDADVTQTEMSPDFGTPVEILMCHSYSTPQVITVALRITDDNNNSTICTVDITVNPSPKNVPLRSGQIAKDLGIRAETSEAYIGFEDGQMWIYEPDYSSGQYRHTFTCYGVNYKIERVDVNKFGDFYLTGDSGKGVNFVKYDSTLLQFRNNDSNYIDVAEVDYPYSGIANWQNGGYSAYLYPGNYGDPTLRNLYVRHSWYGPNPFAITYFPPHVIPEEGEGKVSFYILRGIDGGCAYDYYWALEGAPRYEVERMNGAGTFTGVTIGDNGNRTDTMDGFYDPKDITADKYDNVYILDKLSTGQPVVKKYRADGTPVGMFGDSSSINGEPLRLDADEGADAIHVLHSNGVSVFTWCEIPD